MPSIASVRCFERVAGWEGREVVLDGCTYVEQLQVVAVEGGVAGNVVPDEARVALNHRYAPDRGRAEAEAFLHELLDPIARARRGRYVGAPRCRRTARRPPSSTPC